MDAARVGLAGRKDSCAPRLRDEGDRAVALELLFLLHV